MQCIETLFGEVYAQRVLTTCVAPITVHQRQLSFMYFMDNGRCDRNDNCPQAKWTIIVEHVYSYSGVFFVNENEIQTKRKPSINGP